jgi:fructose-specific phosphotransferase system IIC component
MTWKDLAYIAVVGAAFAVVGGFLTGYATNLLMRHYHPTDGQSGIAVLLYGLLAFHVAGVVGLYVGYRTRH